mmetsp:Transcript_26827/g.67571  ORF Transcript_26827/g.67571 Transcript_26827/m.67571 type:complete len:215 (+) Transcript_26827:211-855(+)
MDFSTPPARAPAFEALLDEPDDAGFFSTSTATTFFVVPPDFLPVLGAGAESERASGSKPERVLDELEFLLIAPIMSPSSATTLSTFIGRFDFLLTILLPVSSCTFFWRFVSFCGSGSWSGSLPFRFRDFAPSFSAPRPSPPGGAAAAGAGATMYRSSSHFVSNDTTTSSKIRLPKFASLQASSRCILSYSIACGSRGCSLSSLRKRSSLVKIPL